MALVRKRNFGGVRIRTTENLNHTNDYTTESYTLFAVWILLPRFSLLFSMSVLKLMVHIASISSLKYFEIYRHKHSLNIATRRPNIRTKFVLLRFWCYHARLRAANCRQIYKSRYARKKMLYRCVDFPKARKTYNTKSKREANKSNESMRKAFKKCIQSVLCFTSVENNGGWTSDVHSCKVTTALFFTKYESFHRWYGGIKIVWSF